ncbi:hypothetical protein M407DRAFT_19335 [Tulasnella calospora MUT 4182]|uniref:Dynamin-type G domain-containing protein n=1 Tax=Tulasnella calospora MUT 4182 TaxID=1051891 RepID=A0A0C3MCT4_9AGAM|nr:hypothetical protein M407DRAFT_19335 [Tulasnella calospora MUT 4182]
MLPAPTAQTPVYGTQDRDSPFDIIPTPMSPSQVPQGEPYGRTYYNPSTRPVTTTVPSPKEPQEQRTPDDSQGAGPGPTSARSRTFVSPRTPRGPGPSATGDEPRMGDYFTKRRELLDVLKSLHSTGIQNELDLPQIVVIGSQSVGKSSLIESMSGLTLPRDTGTCTR